MTRVLLVNKYLFPNAGAETVYLRTRELLQRHGHEVIDFAMDHPANLESPHRDTFARRRDYSDHASPLLRVRDAASAIYSFHARRRLRQLLRRHSPQVAHLHNVYHQLSLSIVDELAAAKVPTVLTLHDYKPVCPSYTLYTAGAPCRRCLHGSVVNAVLHRCVKGSRPASTIAAIEAAFVRKRRVYHMVDRFIAPSCFIADIAREGGLPAERIRVIPNFLAPEPSELPVEPPQRRHFVFAGRLEEVKGLRLLLDAWCQVPPGTPLRIMGRGPLEGLAEERAAASPDIEYLGFQSSAAVQREFDSALALLVPSLWEENCPMTVLEARERSCPVIGAAHGGLPELIRDDIDGMLFAPGDARSLAEKIADLAGDPARASLLGAAGRRHALDRYSAARHYDALTAVYGEVEAQHGAQ